MQGDVIVTCDGPVCVVSHPCSMRKGPELRDTQIVAPIRDHHGGWKGHYDWMPLPCVQFPDMANPAACIRTDGTIICWGSNQFGQARGVIDVPEGSFQTVSAGPAHSCGLRTDGTIHCWGTNDFGQTDAPRGSFQAVSAGSTHSCGLRTDGTIRCWGSNKGGGTEVPISW